MEDIIQEIRDERQRQDIKWGLAKDRNLSPETWLRVLVEEVGEVAAAINDKDWSNYPVELVQVAAVVVAALEDLYTPPVVVDSSSDAEHLGPDGSRAAVEYVLETLKKDPEKVRRLVKDGHCWPSCKSKKHGDFETVYLEIGNKPHGS